MQASLQEYFSSTRRQPFSAALFYMVRAFSHHTDHYSLQVLTETSYTRAVDWWGLGVLIFEMLVGEVRNFIIFL